MASDDPSDLGLSVAPDPEDLAALRAAVSRTRGLPGVHAQEIPSQRVRQHMDSIYDRLGWRRPSAQDDLAVSCPWEPCLSPAGERCTHLVRGRRVPGATHQVRTERAATSIR